MKNTRRMAARRLGEGRLNDKARPQVEQVIQDGQGDQGAQVSPQGKHAPNVGGGNEVLVVPSELNNREIREALLALARAVTTQSNFNMDPRVKYMENTCII